MAQPLTPEMLGQKIGRPKGSPNKSVYERKDPATWAIVENVYVHGEADETGRITYPSFAKLAARIGVTTAAVQARAKRYAWLKRREAAFIERTGIAPPQKSTSSTNDPTNPRRRSRRDAEGVLLDYIDRFDNALRSGGIRADRIEDLDKAVRLLAFVRGDVDSRRETRQTVTLVALQQSHERARGRARELLDDDVAGVLAAGTIDTEGEDVTDTDAPEQAAPTEQPEDAWDAVG